MFHDFLLRVTNLVRRNQKHRSPDIHLLSSIYSGISRIESTEDQIKILIFFYLALHESCAHSLTVMFVGKQELLAVLLFDSHELKRDLAECEVT